MPFQSEKQRRFLHANHPEIAKRWEKEYAHGGILDITGEEETTTDDGNDIELTAYNAAFDDPNDLSTGVKTLFQAKDGGTPQLAKKSKDGTRPGYQGPHAGGYGTTSSSSNKGGGGHPHGGVASQYSGSTQTSSPTTGSGRTRIQEEKQEEFQKQQFKDVTKGTLSDPEEKYDTWEQEFQDIPGTLEGSQASVYKNKVNVAHRQDIYKQKLATQKSKLKKMGLGKLVMPAIMILAGVPINFALKSITVTPKDLMTAVQHSLPVMKAKKELIEALGLQKGALLGQVDILNPNEMKSKIGMQISDITNEIKELTTTPEDDDTKGDGPEVPQVVPVHEEIEEYEGTYAMSPWDRIKANQAKRAMLVEKDIIQENPIVDESVTDITMQANKGGLANLFRVKNQ
jgi:hypothetical protein